MLERVDEQLLQKHWQAYFAVNNAKKSAQKTAKKKPPKPVDRSKRAASKLRLAKLLIKSRKTKAAKRYLVQIVEKFPKTEAAAEALKLLKTVNRKNTR
jgi:TolA-binding protein